MSERTREIVDRLQITLPDFDAPVALMSGGQRQAVAVARAVAFSSKLVILDEPTAALGLRESGRVLDLIQRLKSDGDRRDPDLPQHGSRHGGRRPCGGAPPRSGRRRARSELRQPRTARGVDRRRRGCHSTDDEQHAQKEIHMRSRRLLAVGAGLALIAAGCGDDDDAESSARRDRSRDTGDRSSGHRCTGHRGTGNGSTGHRSTGHATPGVDRERRLPSRSPS